MNPLTKVGNNFVIPRREPRVSNELVKLDVEHQHHVEDVKLEIQRESQSWKSCCFELHPASNKFETEYPAVRISIAAKC